MQTIICTTSAPHIYVLCRDTIPGGSLSPNDCVPTVDSAAEQADCAQVVARLVAQLRDVCIGRKAATSRVLASLADLWDCPNATDMLSTHVGCHLKTQHIL